MDMNRDLTLDLIEDHMLSQNKQIIENTIFIFALIMILFSACNDESDRVACEKATKELINKVLP